MATAISLINSALRTCRILGSEETATAEDSIIGLAVLNALLGSWSLENLTVYRVKEETFALAAGTASYTIGAGGVFNTDRPPAIESAFMRVTNVDYPVLVLEKQTWDRVPDKLAVGSIVTELFYDPAYPLGVIHVWPVPNNVQSLHINSMQQFTSAATLSTDIPLPPGYEIPLKNELAIMLGSELNAPVSESVYAIASRTKAILKRKNIRKNRSTFDFPVGISSNILIG